MLATKGSAATPASVERMKAIGPHIGFETIDGAHSIHNTNRDEFLKVLDRTVSEAQACAERNGGYFKYPKSSELKSLPGAPRWVHKAVE